MRVICTACNTKGKITSTRAQTKEFSTLYCLCLNPECGHTWVAHLSYSHSLREPVKQVRTLDTLLLDQLDGLPPAQRQLLIDHLGKQPGI